MKYFRHPPVAFWALMTAALALVAALAWHVGSSAPAPLALAGTTLADENPHALAVMERVGQVAVVSVPPARDLNAWADQTADMASQNAVRRATEAGSTDPVALAYAAIAADARALAVVDPADSGAVLELRGKIGIDRDRLAAAAAGVTVPGMPDAPTSAVQEDRTLMVPSMEQAPAAPTTSSSTAAPFTTSSLNDPSHGENS